MNTRSPAILVVDDEEKIRAGLADFFEDEGFCVSCAGSAEEGLTLLAGLEADLCTVDIRLPGASGNEFIVRAHAIKPRLKFLIYTGSADYELTDAVRQAGLNEEDVITKPAEKLGLLLSAVNRLLGRAGQ
jgi:two-component system, OmpR family, response regulator